MGWNPFESEGHWQTDTYTNVYTSSVNLSAPSIDITLVTTVQHLLTHKNMDSAVLADINLKASYYSFKRMLSYANDTYTLGLPTSTTHQNVIVVDENDVAAAIATDLSIGNGVAIDYAIIAPPYSEVLINYKVLPFLIASRGYDEVENTISIMPAGLTLTTTTTGNGWQRRGGGLPVTNIVYVQNIDLAQDGVTATITYLIKSSYLKQTTVGSGEFGSETYTYELTYLADATYDEEYEIPVSFIIGEPYCIAKYWELDDVGAPIAGNNWWYYRLADKTYPALDITYTPDDAYNLFPVIPLRYDNVDMLDFVDPTIYTTGKKLLGYIGLDIDLLREGLNATPDIADIDHAYVMFAVDIHTEKPENNKYLIDFFDYLHDQDAMTQNSYTTNLLDHEIPNQQVVTFNSYDSTDETGNAASLIENGLNVNISYDYITSVMKAGSIGDVGTVTKTFTYDTKISKHTFANPAVTTYYNKKFTIQRQITAGYYKEVVVAGLVHTNKIYGEYSIVTDIMTLAADVTKANHNFLIPLNRTVVDMQSLHDRHILLQQCTMMVVNSLVITVHTYYVDEGSWFSRNMGWIMVVVVVIVAIYVAPMLTANISAAFQAASVAAIEAGATVAAAYAIGQIAVAAYIAVTLGTGFIISQAFKLAVEVLGIENSFVLAVLTLAVAAYSGYTNANGIMGLTTQDLLMGGQCLLNASSTVMEEKSLEYLSDPRLDITSQLAEIRRQYDLDVLNHEKMYDELEKIEKLYLIDKWDDMGFASYLDLTKSDMSNKLIQPASDMWPYYFFLRTKPSNYADTMLSTISLYPASILTLKGSTPGNESFATIIDTNITSFIQV